MAAGSLFVKLIINALKDNFTAFRKQKYTVYLSVSCRNLLKHIIDTYANIGGFNLHENQLRLDSSYDSNQSIKVLFRQIMEAVAFADAGDAPFTAR